MGVALQIRKALDHIAKGKQTAQAAYLGTRNLRGALDDAADFVYEDRVAGADITAVDAALQAAECFSGASQSLWWKAHHTYFRTDLAKSDPYFDNYLASVGMRMPWEAAQAHYEAFRSRVGTHLVFPKGTLVAANADPANSGMHLFGTWTGASTYAESAGALDATKIVGSPIVAISREASQGATSATVTVTLQDGTTKDIVVAASDTQYAQVVVGAQAITGVAGAVFNCAATAQFKVGEYVLLYEGAEGAASQRESGKVKTIVTNTSVEFESAPVNTFSAAGFIRPMFTNVTRKSGTLTSGKHLDFYALPDRIIALV